MLPSHRRQRHGQRHGKSKKTSRTAAAIPDSLARLQREQAGQGLVEYVLILALVGFMAVAGMSSLASSVNSAFSTVATYIEKYIS